jgi:hypothetical protein
MHFLSQINGYPSSFLMENFLVYSHKLRPRMNSGKNRSDRLAPFVNAQSGLLVGS